MPDDQEKRSGQSPTGNIWDQLIALSEQRRKETLDAPRPQPPQTLEEAFCDIEKFLEGLHELYGKPGPLPTAVTSPQSIEQIKQAVVTCSPTDELEKSARLLPTRTAGPILAYIEKLRRADHKLAERLQDGNFDVAGEAITEYVVASFDAFAETILAKVKTRSEVDVYARTLQCWLSERVEAIEAPFAVYNAGRIWRFKIRASPIMARIHHWKAEATHKVRKQSEQRDRVRTQGWVKLAQTLQYYRRLCDWSLSDLATAAELPLETVRSHVYKSKKRLPGPDNLVSYANAFSDKLGYAVKTEDLTKGRQISS